jgi:hypothetical protein
VQLPTAKFAPLTDAINMLDKMMERLDLTLIPSQPSVSEQVINFKAVRNLRKVRAA